MRSEIYFDLETLKLSDEVAGGWSNIREFGLAVGVSWDRAHAFRHWFEKDARKFVAELESFSRIITFNGERFDFEVLQAYADVGRLYRRSLDLHADLQTRLGHRVSLASVAWATLGRGKSGTGLEVIDWWRSGQRERVVKYCEMDVQLLIDLVAFARQHGHVLIEGARVPVSWGERPEHEEPE